MKIYKQITAEMIQNDIRYLELLYNTKSITNKGILYER